MLTRSTKMKRTLGLALGGLMLIGAGCKTGTTVDLDVNIAPPSGEDDKMILPDEEKTEGDGAMMDGGDKMSDAHYKDGTYTAEGDYTYHSGSEKITLGITLKNDVIVDSTFAAVPSVPMSGKFMGYFEGGYKALIIGKNVNEVHLDKVSGSSRTPIGFNDALTKIKAQAVIK